MLTKPSSVLSIDLGRESIGETTSGQKYVTHVEMEERGTAHAILVWWELDLWHDDEKTISYSLKPGDSPWQDHWHQCLHVLPTPYTVVDSLSLRAWHNDSRVFVTIDEQPKQPDSKRSRQDDNSTSPVFTNERVMQLNCQDRLAFYRQAIKGLLHRRPDAKLLDLSDFSLCATLAAIEGCRNVVSLESSSGDLPMAAARMAQIDNGLPREGCKFEILNCHAEQLSLEVLGGSPMCAVAAEPYYEVLEGWGVQEALNYFFLVRSSHTRGMVSQRLMSIPSSCRFMACVIESDQLRSAYRPCGTDGSAIICGIDHAAVNKYGDRFHEYDLNLPMWQYDYRRLSDDVELLKLNFQSPSKEATKSETRVTVKAPGTADAIMLWLCYTAEAEDGSTIEFSTLSCSSRQCIRMMPRPLKRQVGDARELDIVISISIGGIDDEVSYKLSTWVDK